MENRFCIVKMWDLKNSIPNCNEEVSFTVSQIKCKKCDLDKCCALVLAISYFFENVLSLTSLRRLFHLKWWKCFTDSSTFLWRKTKTNYFHLMKVFDACESVFSFRRTLTFCWNIPVSFILHLSSLFHFPSSLCQWPTCRNAVGVLLEISNCIFHEEFTWKGWYSNRRASSLWVVP